MLKVQRFLYQTFRLLSDVEETEGEVGEFGVRITYQNLYHSIVFLTCIYVGGLIASRFLKMPDLVGQIVVGILLGPNLADFVPNPEAWVLFGEIGLVLLVLDAGMDVDMDTLKLIGARGFIIAFFGSLFPIGIGISLALAIGTDTKGAIAAGASFGPTSMGIALNILRSGGILNTPVGQLIVSAAVIDDMIALVVLSFLETLTTEITAKTIVVPIVSALLFLVIGGYIAINVAPSLIGRYILTRVEEKNHAKVELAIMIGLLLALMPATYYAEASYLMGSFLAGLVFCQSDGLHSLFVSQFKRIIQWLMRFFFAASIGFQVPIKNFGDGTVIWQGLMFTLAFTGKLGVGFMVPNFLQAKRFRGDHLRDCLITGCAMASEGEFALVIAVFSVDAGLTSVKLYSSIVLAILLSTIFPPFMLRFTIHYYRKKAERNIQEAAEEVASKDDDLLETITKQSTLFLCIQTQSKSRWGLMYDILNAMYKLGLEVIDHRSWHPRGVNTTLVNEIYCKGSIDPALLTPGNADIVVAEHITKFRKELLEAINQPEVAKVKIERWCPGAVEELIEESEQKLTRRKYDTKLSFEDRLLSEATEQLEKKRQFQLAATKQKSVACLLIENEGGQKRDMMFEVPENILTIGSSLFKNSTYGTQKTGMEVEALMEGADNKRLQELAMQAEPAAGDVESQIAEAGYTTPATRPKPSRRKMLSAPAGDSGRFFGADEPVTSEEDAKAEFERFGRHHKLMTGRDQFFAPKSGPAGIQAELLVQGETFRIRIPQATLELLRKGYSGESIDNRGLYMSGITMTPQDSPVVNMLQGYVRSGHPKIS